MGQEISSGQDGRPRTVAELSDLTPYDGAERLPQIPAELAFHGGRPFGADHGFNRSGLRLPLDVLEGLDPSTLTVKEAARLVDAITWANAGDAAWCEKQQDDSSWVGARPNATGVGNLAFVALHAPTEPLRAAALAQVQGLVKSDPAA